MKNLTAAQVIAHLPTDIVLFEREPNDDLTEYKTDFQDLLDAIDEDYHNERQHEVYVSMQTEFITDRVWDKQEDYFAAAAVRAAAEAHMNEEEFDSFMQRAECGATYAPKQSQGTGTYRSGV